ncbi:MAG: hypothetical protein LBS97_00950 [Treponema sp.]|jgi:PIN domain nuclease of toxin-antitoxin system|nr:hypothetical protein [Treponema sp.]
MKAMAVGEVKTHTVLWAIGKSRELSQKAVKELKDTNNDILVSAVSLWEIALKYRYQECGYI